MEHIAKAGTRLGVSPLSNRFLVVRRGDALARALDNKVIPSPEVESLTKVEGIEAFDYRLYH